MGVYIAKYAFNDSTHASPFSWLTAFSPSPMFTKSSSTKFGARPAAKPSQPAAFARILQTRKEKKVSHDCPHPQQAEMALTREHRWWSSRRWGRR